MLFTSLTLAFLGASALAAPSPTTADAKVLIPVARSDQLASSFRQTNRRQILQRAEQKTKRSARRAALGKRQQASAPVFQTCSDLADEALYARGTGFASITGYVISRGSANNIDGNLQGVASAAVCAALCQNYDGCTGYEYNYNSQECNFRSGTVPAASSWVTATSGYIMGVRGSCAEIAEYVNDNTIMANCCDNRNTASTVCGGSYPNHGAVCVAGQKSLSGNGPVQTANINSNGNSDLYQQCTDLCRARTAAAYSNRNNAYCSAVQMDGYKVRDGTNNCFLFGNQPGSMEAAQDAIQASFILGTCQQIKNNIPYTDSVQSVANCDSESVNQDI